MTKLTICSLNDAVDDQGRRTQGFSVCDEQGRTGWLRPGLRLRLAEVRLDLKPGDVVLAGDFIAGGDQWPALVADSIQKVASRN